MNRSILLLLTMTMILTVTACGREEPEQQQEQKSEPQKEAPKEGLGSIYKQMLDQSRKSADDANERTSETERRARADE